MCRENDDQGEKNLKSLKKYFEEEGGAARGGSEDSVERLAMYHLVDHCLLVESIQQLIEILAGDDERGQKRTETRDERQQTGEEAKGSSGEHR